MKAAQAQGLPSTDPLLSGAVTQLEDVEHLKAQCSSVLAASRAAPGSPAVDRAHLTAALAVARSGQQATSELHISIA